MDLQIHVGIQRRHEIVLGSDSRSGHENLPLLLAILDVNPDDILQHGVNR